MLTTKSKYEYKISWRYHGLDFLNFEFHQLWVLLPAGQRTKGSKLRPYIEFVKKIRTEGGIQAFHASTHGRICSLIFVSQKKRSRGTPPGKGFTHHHSFTRWPALPVQRTSGEAGPANGDAYVLCSWRSTACQPDSLVKVFNLVERSLTAHAIVPHAFRIRLRLLHYDLCRVHPVASIE